MEHKTVTEAIQYRRSVRVYDPEKKILTSAVKACLKNAVLAPNSSNMQLWEFYHITSKDIIGSIAPMCFNQNAAKTAQQLVVVVVRKDLWKQRAKANLRYLDSVFGANNPKSKQSSREKVARNYYNNIIPFAYADVLGLLGWLKFVMVTIVGIFRPIYRQVRSSHARNG